MPDNIAVCPICGRDVRINPDHHTYGAHVEKYATRRTPDADLTRKRCVMSGQPTGETTT